MSKVVATLPIGHFSSFIFNGRAVSCTSPWEASVTHGVCLFEAWRAVWVGRLRQLAYEFCGSQMRGSDHNTGIVQNRALKIFKISYGFIQYIFVTLKGAVARENSILWLVTSCNVAALRKRIFSAACPCLRSNVVCRFRRLYAPRHALLRRLVCRARCLYFVPYELPGNKAVGFYHHLGR